MMAGTVAMKFKTIAAAAQRGDVIVAAHSDHHLAWSRSATRVPPPH
ncbi:MAG TPA: hypothetical protein PKE64_15240 [Anaerolineae bacterium]|nr:hypothetical protein [Anaerolineae bacterium]